MDGVVYLIWVSIPVTLVLLAVLAKANQQFFPRGEEDPNRPRRILRLANVFGIYAVVCVCIDRFLLDALVAPVDALWPLRPHQMGAVRSMLLPVVAGFGSLLFLVERALNPRAGFDKLRIDVRGSNPLYLLIALAILAVMIWDRGQKEGATFNLRGLRNLETQSTTTTQSPNSSTTASKQTSLKDSAFTAWDQIRGNGRDFLDELKAIAGVQTAPQLSITPRPMARLPQGERPDYNSEGASTFGPTILEIASEEQVDPLLVRALIEIASGYNQRWVSSSGNHGLMGLRPGSVKDYGERDLFNIHQNIRIGCKELKIALEAEGNDQTRALLLFRYGKPRLEDLGATSTEAQDFVNRVAAVYEILAVKGN